MLQTTRICNKPSTRDLDFETIFDQKSRKDYADRGRTSIFVSHFWDLYVPSSPVASAFALGKSYSRAPTPVPSQTRVLGPPVNMTILTEHRTKKSTFKPPMFSLLKVTISEAVSRKPHSYGLSGPRNTAREQRPPQNRIARSNDDYVTRAIQQARRQSGNGPITTAISLSLTDELLADNSSKRALSKPFPQVP